MATDDRARNLVLLIALLVMVVATAAFLAPRVSRFFEIDACLDSGGAWIAAISKCSHDQAEVDRYPRR